MRVVERVTEVLDYFYGSFWPPDAVLGAAP